MIETDKMTKAELAGYYNLHKKQITKVIDSLENMVYNTTTTHIWYKLEAESLLEEIRSGFTGTTEA